MRENLHQSVMAVEAPEVLVRDASGIYVDGTFGRGGHSKRILGKLSPGGRLIAFDRDPEAVAAASGIADPRFSIVHAPFSRMREELAARGVDRVSGVFLDIGVSSPQIDDASRGFSFRFDGPLDMRMDTSTGVTAAEWLERAPEDEIRRVIGDFGEERFARAIAREIVSVRAAKPLRTTGELARLVARVVPRNRRDAGQHPATRTFQAVRIEVNRELDELREALRAAGELLGPGGVLAVITFHSLEDRIVKRFFDAAAHPGRALDPRLPIPAEGLPAPLFEEVLRVKPSEAECAANPRARSAILRAAVRTASPWRED